MKVNKIKIKDIIYNGFKKTLIIVYKDGKRRGYSGDIAVRIFNKYFKEDGTN